MAAAKATAFPRLATESHPDLCIGAVDCCRLGMADSPMSVCETLCGTRPKETHLLCGLAVRPIKLSEEVIFEAVSAAGLRYLGVKCSIGLAAAYADSD